MRSIVLMISLFIFLFNTNAQNVVEEIRELVDFHILNEGNLAGSNLAIIRQDGIGNNLVAVQQSKGISSQQIISEQKGIGNFGYIDQTGDAHAVVLNQNGSGNEANIWSEGSVTATMVIQSGDDNTINSYIDNEGVLPKAALLQQNGNNNVIDFALLGNGCLWNSWPKGAYIKQTGNDLEVTALFDSYQSPIYIEQQSGVNGGMSVNVSTTAFSFPMKKF